MAAVCFVCAVRLCVQAEPTSSGESHRSGPLPSASLSPAPSLIARCSCCCPCCAGIASAARGCAPIRRSRIRKPDAPPSRSRRRNTTRLLRLWRQTRASREDGKKKRRRNEEKPSTPRASSRSLHRVRYNRLPLEQQRLATRHRVLQRREVSLNKRIQRSTVLQISRSAPDSESRARSIVSRSAIRPVLAQYKASNCNCS